MFLLNGKRLTEGVPFVDAKGTQYGSDWLYKSTEAEKLAIGIIWVADPIRLDDRFIGMVIQLILRHLKIKKKQILKVINISLRD